MSNVLFKETKNQLTILLSGRIDSTNAQANENEIIEKIRASHPAKIEIDCSELNYISSAGLRVILRVKKTVPDTVIVNVQSEVYEIFEMTGFTEMMEVRKAYRVIDVSGCEVIGKGANGEVYRIDPDTIVKVYLNPDSLEDIHRERELARTAFVLGVPTAIPYDIVRVKSGGYGSVFELLNAKSLAKLLSEGEAGVERVTEMSVDLLKIIHGTVVRPDQMPDMKKTAVGWTDLLKEHLPADSYQKLRAMIEAVPDDNHMLHGDYHLKNVMLQNGECLLIDMDTLCHGHPIFEFGSIYNAYQGFGYFDHDTTKRFLGIDFDVTTAIWNNTLKLYFKGRSEEEIAQIAQKAQLIGITRILRRCIRRGEKPGVIDGYRKLLIDLIGSVDSLTF